MFSLSFPFPWFPPSNNIPNHSFSISTATATAIACTATAATGIAISNNPNKNPVLENALNFIISHFLPSNLSPSSWASLSLSSNAPPPVVEFKTGASFPSVIKDSQTLLGIGLRRKSILGLKNIDVYAFGVYADEADVQKNLKEKYGQLSASELKDNKDFNGVLLASDVNLTVRLQIVYSKLSIRAVRGAFEESVGRRLQKFGGPNKELLHRFTSQFKDELKIPKGSVIELAREHGHVLHTTIDGEEVGSIQSKLLCQSLLDLYIGEDPLDQQARENVMVKLANVFEKRKAHKGFKLVAIKILVPSKDFAQKHYHDLKERPFFNGLCDFLSSGPVVAMVWEGEGVIRYGRKLIGATDPQKSEPGTIRGDLAVVVGRNIIHGSDGPETAKDEIKLWFKPEELVNYTNNAEKWIYGDN